MHVDNELRNDKKVLHWEDFSGYVHTDDFTVTPQISSCFRNLLEKYEETENYRYLVLPSPIALAGFFKCTEIEIMAALQELQRQGYEYEISGIAGPITLSDPLIGRRDLEAEEAYEQPHWQHWIQQLFAKPLNLNNQW
jgi:hypothetical protein